MFRKTLLSTLAAVVLATSGFSASTTIASANDRSHDRKVAAGVAFGAAALVLGAIAYSNQNNGYERPRNQKHRRHMNSDGYDAVECYDKPIRRFDRRLGRKVTVAYKTVCY